ncbi:hypothetical protein [Kocuria sp.]|uniref:hypothetical protein n=1 Tax=Kocuria sp. TaxID=1871328 RepID=UPI00289A3E14|nr:hypothetical protein [Kocuria sp.]
MVPPTVTTTASAPAIASRTTAGSVALPTTLRTPAGALPLRDKTVTFLVSSSRQ